MGPLPALIPMAIGAAGSAIGAVGSAVGSGIGAMGSMLGGLGGAGAATGGAGSFLTALNSGASILGAGSTILSAVNRPKVPSPQTAAQPQTPAPPRPFQNSSLAAMSPALALGGTMTGIQGSLGQGQGKTLLGQ